MNIENKIDEIKKTIKHLNNELRYYKYELEKKKDNLVNKDVKSILNCDLDDPELFKDWYLNLHLC